MIEERSANAEEQLLQLLYLCPVAIAKIATSGTIRDMNPAGAQLLMPVARDDAIENLFDVFSVGAPELGAMVRRFPRPAGRICNEYRVLARTMHGGPARTCIFSLTMHKVDRDTIVAVIADVTGAAQREDAARASEARLHAVFDSVRDCAIATFDRDGVVTGFNSAAEAMDGHRASDVVGRPASALRSTTGRIGIAEWLERARRCGWYERTGWRVRRDGSRYWANSAVSLLRGPGDGELLGFSLMTRDLTEQKRTMDGLRRLASTDSLTGLLSRRAFFEAAVRQEKPFRELGRPSAVLMLDLDFFKHVNDRHGHQTGDAVLRAASAAAREEVRAGDVIGRYGGEEFVVLLRGCRLDPAIAVAERIRTRIAEATVDAGGTAVHVTVSIGVAILGTHSNDIASTIAAADRALYTAKEMGRNRVVADGSPPA